MKSKRRFVEVVIVFVLLCLVTPLYAATPWLHTQGNQIKDPAGNVVVLRGVDLIDLGAIQTYYGGVIPLISRVTNTNDTNGSSPGWYPRIIRLPIYPVDETAFASVLTFDPSNDDYYNTVLRPVVDYCKTQDVYAIIDWHYINNTYYSTHQATTSEFWQYMAPRFANDSHVIFELFNEPTNGGNWTTVKSDMQTWVNIVRKYAPYNLILVGGPTYDQVLAPQATNPIDGNNIVYVWHMYPGYGTSGWNDVNTLQAAGYPVFMSEWGFDMSTTAGYLHGTITGYGQPLMNFVERLGIPLPKVGNSAWEACLAWEPPMFNLDWSLRVGETHMGGFVKDTLYLRRNDDQPSEGSNIWPTVSVTSPLDGDIFHQGDDIVIEANASDSDGNVTKVEFYCQGNKLGEAANAPYSYTWANVPAGRYSLAARATDNSGAITVSLPVSVGVTNGGATGTILREWWATISGAYVSYLTADVNYPNNPNDRGLMRRLQGPSNWGRYYGARFRGYLYPPATGSYTFYIESSCESQLRLSTDSDPGNSVLIANVTFGSGPPPYPAIYGWTTYSSQKSSPISLTAGGKYYIEVLHKESSVAVDHVAVAWEGPGITQQVIDGVYLSPYLYNFKDYAIFAPNWQRTDCAKPNAWCNGADRDRDGQVGPLDLMSFADWWLSETQ